MQKLIWLFVLFVAVFQSQNIFCLNNYKIIDSTKDTIVNQDFSRNVIFGELGGNGIIFSINYEGLIKKNLE